MRFSYLSLFILVLFTVLSHADIGVDMDAARTEFLLYESIDVQVKVRNSSSQTLDTSKVGKNSWLDITVVSSRDEDITRTSREWKPEPIIVPGGEIKSISVNLTPLYLIREPDEYKIYAHLYIGDQEFVSRPLRIIVTKGQPVWLQRYTAAPDPSDPEKKPRSRIYSLLIHNTKDSQMIYVRIMDPTTSKVYCTTSLGSVVNYQDPNTRIDIKGDLHILHQSGTRIYTYSHLNPQGKMVKSRFFANLGSEPKMIASGKGETDVVGGEEIFKNPNGMMELIPTAPEMKLPSHENRLIERNPEDTKK
jgi:hypothetical protein